MGVSGRIGAVAFNTLREAIRDKILYSLLFFALLTIGASVLIGKLTIGGYLKIIKDVGLASVSIFGVMIAVFVGIQLTSKEIERRTVYTVLSKPVHRHEFLLGKFAGLALTLLIEVGVMVAGLIGLVLMEGGKGTLGLLQAGLLIYMELILITAFALLFSSFSSTTLSALFTFSVYLIGHSTNDIYQFGKRSEEEWIRKVTEIAYFVLPNLENFNLKNQIVHSVPLIPGQLEFALAYGVLYTFVVLLGAIGVFQQRDFR